MDKEVAKATPVPVATAVETKPIIKPRTPWTARIIGIDHSEGMGGMRVSCKIFKNKEFYTDFAASVTSKAELETQLKAKLTTLKNVDTEMAKIKIGETITL